MPEKLMLPELEKQYGTTFKAFVGALRPHINDKGRMTAGGKPEI